MADNKNNITPNAPQHHTKALSRFAALFKSKKAASVAALVLAAAIAAPSAILFSSKDHKPINVEENSVSEEFPGQTPIDPRLKIDENAGEYVEPEKVKNESKGVAIPGWGSITIPADTADISVDFFNPEENRDQYYLTFELRLPDQSEQGYETLYASGLVEPGLHIQKVSLSRELDAGKYEAIIHVQPYRMDDNYTATNNADLKTELIVI